MDIKAWKKIGEPKVLAQKFGLSFFLQKFEDPYKESVQEYVQIGTIPFICIVMPITVDDQVLAVRQYRRGADKILLELPGGNPKTSVQPRQEVAEEELFEESGGYIAKEMVMLSPDPLWSEPTILPTPFYAFLALDCVQTNKKVELDEGEYIELVKIPLAEWFELCMSGSITDSKSMTVTFLAQKTLMAKNKIKF